MGEKFVVTISHLLGSGGASIGKGLSDILSVPFVDRQILKQVSDFFDIPEEDIENREERIRSFWQSFVVMGSFGVPMVPGTIEYFPSDRELFKLESEFIEQISGKSSAIILGRCGRFILRKHPHHFSVFVHADMKDRLLRVSELYHVSKDESKKIIDTNDRERNAYIKTFTRQEWLDARTYDMCINTSSIGFDHAVTVIKNSLQSKLDLYANHDD